MIELEIQTLSETREGLLIEVGRLVMSSGFTLQRQRLVQDHHGVLMTMVVRGPWLKRRALEASLDANERIISFRTAKFEEGAPKPHFAASRPMAGPAVVAVSAAAIKTERPPVPTAVADEGEAAEPAATQVISAEPEPQQEPEFVFMVPRAQPPAPVPAEATPFVDLIPLGPDMEAVEKVLPKLTNDYPHILSRLLALEGSVAEAARDSSLFLAGQRTGVWVFERDFALDAGLALDEAIERVGVPALRALVEVENQGEQLHIRNSPLCLDGGHSRCQFFSGYLDGLLGRAIASKSLSIFAVCCRSCGADECVLAISD
ncbi:hypothetical protein [Rhodanobacter sp. C01]|uniref:hypothetical protein n=1 Tax=Rhodanobacter sp. C01 TaxID=1945856 RepID=UPI000986AAAB|nr:hypothetical protein [Rhodanobacter sp. C01]OOG49065.1 hypothetical protein B0E50_06585 [Rhodanobacter sp. C01]